MHENLKRREILFSSPEEAQNHLFKSQKIKPNQEYLSKVFGNLQLGVCGTIASERYQFSSSNIHFEEYSTPEWISNLRYRSIFSIPEFDKTCVPITEERRVNLIMAEHASDISKDLKKDFSIALKGIDSCRKFTQRMCFDIEQMNNGQLAKHYVTEGCTVRSVTVADVKRDVAEWATYSVNTEADRVRHSEMVMELEFCDRARTAGFGWDFVRPRVKNCSARSKKSK